MEVKKLYCPGRVGYCPDRVGGVPGLNPSQPQDSQSCLDMAEALDWADLQAKALQGHDLSNQAIAGLLPLLAAGALQAAALEASGALRYLGKQDSLQVGPAAGSARLNPSAAALNTALSCPAAPLHSRASAQCLFAQQWAAARRATMCDAAAHGCPDTGQPPGAAGQAASAGGC